MECHATMKLGKHAAREDSRNLKLLDYLGKKRMPAKAAIDWSGRVSRWGMMMNDTLGDCTCAAAGHMIEAWTSEARRPVTVADEEIVSAYSAVTGYNPADPPTDRGAVVLDVLKYWRTTGINGHRILAFVALEPRQTDHVKVSLELFGGCYVGLALPLSAQTQAVWDVPADGTDGNGAAGTWGGHAVPVVAYDAAGLTVVTWGATKRMTWRFWHTYCDEAYAVLSQDWIDDKGVNPEAFSLDQLKTDLIAVSGNGAPQAA
jgi:hypothetical protein